MSAGRRASPGTDYDAATNVVARLAVGGAAGSRRAMRLNVDAIAADGHAGQALAISLEDPSMQAPKPTFDCAVCDRRSMQPSPLEGFLRLRFGAFELDEAEARLTRDGRGIALPPKAFNVLCTLARRPHSLVTKDGLLDAVWGHRFVTESVLKTTISELRAGLEDSARQPRYVETVPRRGYRFIGNAAVHVPRTPTPVPAPSITGRLKELGRLQAAWDAACAGRRQMVWVTGEAGVGKSALIDRFVRGLGAVACGHGHCVEQHGAGEPFLPVLEAVAELCRVDPAAPALLREVAPASLQQLPWLAGPGDRATVGAESTHAGRAGMLRELGEFLDRYSEHRPLLLVTSNLHWCDGATVQLMDHVARRRRTARLMWLASFRLPEIIATDHVLCAVRRELRLHGLCEEIVLDPFSEGEVAEYLCARTPALAGDEALVRAIHERTAGLPLFVAALIDEALARQAAGRVPDAAWALAHGVPETLAGMATQSMRPLAAFRPTVSQAVRGDRLGLLARAVLDDRTRTALRRGCHEHDYRTELSSD